MSLAWPARHTPALRTRTVPVGNVGCGGTSEGFQKFWIRILGLTIEKKVSYDYLEAISDDKESENCEMNLYVK